MKSSRTRGWNEPSSLKPDEMLKGSATPPMPALTVATFNVRYGTAPDGPNHWEHRWPLFGHTLQAIAADVFCLQEVLPFQLAHVHHVLPGYHAVGVSRNDGRRGGEMVPIVWRVDRFELIDAGHFWLGAEPHIPGVFGWDARHPRMVTWAALRFVRPPRAVFTVINTHFENRGSQNRGSVARAESAALIHRRVAALGPHMPVIVCGDFNSTENDPPYAALRQERLEPGDGLRDAYRLMHPTPDPTADGTYHKFTGRQDVDRIDWVLVSRHWNVTAARIDHTSRGGRFPSDHFPVVAELELV